MIVFLTFAPIEFMGGAEKMVYKLAKSLCAKEKIVVINADFFLANIYGQLVLKRKFDDRRSADVKNNFVPKTAIGFTDFIPFTPGWRKIRKSIKEARIVFMKYELPELFFLTYFGGFDLYKKTVASLQTPLLYEPSGTFFESLHKIIYESSFSKFLLKHMKSVHVLSKRDELFLTEKFRLPNIVRIPNGLALPKESQSVNKNRKRLYTLFVGELSVRKGVDILLDLMEKMPDQYVFMIAGDGPMKKEIVNFCKKRKNCIYFHFVKSAKIRDLYKKSDILFAPSRAEGLSLVMLEALSYGLKIIGQENILFDFPDYAKSTIEQPKYYQYEDIFYKELMQKKQGIYNQKRAEIRNYFQNSFSEEKIIPEMHKKIFDMNL